MTSTDKLLKCIICQRSFESSTKNACSKGHIHCKACTASLDNICGLCDLPLKPIEEVKDDKKYDQNNKAQEVLGIDEIYAMHGKELETDENKNETELNFVDYEELENCDEEATLIATSESHTTVESSSRNRRKSSGQEMSILSFGKTSSFTTKSESFEKLNELAILYHQDLKPLVVSSSTEIPDIESCTVSQSLIGTLKAFHKTSCNEECKNFDYCIPKLLANLINDVTKAQDKQPDCSIRGTESVTDLLETLHVNLCEQNCSDLENCLQDKLGKFLTQKDVVAEGTPPPSRISKLIKANSNVVRALYKPRSASELPRPQFEMMNELSKLNVTTPPVLSTKPVQEKVNDNYLPVRQEQFEQFQCPLPDCAVHLSFQSMISHIKDQHKQLSVEVLAESVCKIFFVDPSILEEHEASCLLCYYMPNVFEVRKKRAALPIFLMALRTSLSKIFLENGIDYGAASNGSNVLKQQTNSSDAIFGPNRKIKRQPVVWSKDNVLILWPIAPIPLQITVKTVLSVFIQNTPSCHRSVSFNLRSLQHSRAPFDVFGAPDTLTLTNVEIDALTSQGQHAIQCQIVFNL